ncbi:MAG TPA: hypothetical protein VFV38_18680 [Ktedonobacteraceae bacterium]|nr:hypothetical protein [Ktedonobacteraceae bacterium]
MCSPLSAHPTTVPQVPLEAGHRCAALLPLVEAQASAPDAAWLLSMASQVLAAVEETLPINILPMRTIDFLATPLPIWRAQPLLIVPWTITQEHFPGASGIQWFQHLGLERILGTFPLVPLARPRPALAELLSLSFLGGWDAGSHTGLSQLVTLCPGWDEVISLCGPVCVLRGPQRSLPTALPSPEQYQNDIRLLRAASSGERATDTHADLDRQCTERSMSRILTATVQAVLAAQQRAAETNTDGATSASWEERDR